MSIEKTFRHMQAAHASDFEFLRQQIHGASMRFFDLADIIEKDRAYDPVPFLRASAERYKRAANLED